MILCVASGSLTSKGVVIVITRFVGFWTVVEVLLDASPEIVPVYI